MKVIVLASGSTGNCIYVQGSSGAIFIDAGRSGKEILGTKNEQGLAERAGCKLDMIEGVLVTHEHTDHIRGLKPVCSRLNIPAYGTAGTLSSYKAKYSGTKPPKCTNITCGEPFEVAGLSIEAFSVSHDATDPCGYMITDGDLRLGYCTDTGHISSAMQETLSHADALVLESNHCPDMLKNGGYPPYLKKRIASHRGHLSNPDAAELLCALANNLHSVILAHISEENNDPMLALKTADASCINDDLHLFAASTIPTRSACIRESGRECCVFNKEAWKYSIDLM
ncbi:MAG: MBL fold metallo-hydrolase [Methanomicrobiales archaeon]|jgi:phosphoribosyl 1,2-cyclic phosphodiesterase|nr:MBL fold metallo-hydrolase [Methanomicrobiales archaeon]